MPETFDPYRVPVQLIGECDIVDAIRVDVIEDYLRSHGWELTSEAEYQKPSSGDPLPPAQPVYYVVRRWRRRRGLGYDWLWVPMPEHAAEWPTLRRDTTLNHLATAMDTSVLALVRQLYEETVRREEG